MLLICWKLLNITKIVVNNLNYSKKPIPYKLDSIVEFKDKNLTIICNQPNVKSLEK